MFRIHRAHHQERQILSIQPLVPEAVLIKFVSPDDGNFINRENVYQPQLIIIKTAHGKPAFLCGLPTSVNPTALSFSCTYSVTYCLRIPACMLVN